VGRKSADGNPDQSAHEDGHWSHFLLKGNRNAVLELMITRPLSLVPMLTLKQANSFEIRHLDGHDRKKDKLDLNPRSNER
jgi:hypothetical protein